MPTYNNERRPTSRPNELALALFFPEIIERIGTHRSKDCVFSPFSREYHAFLRACAIFCMLIIFSIEHHRNNSPYRFALSIKRLSVHPKSSNHSGNLDHYRCGELIIRLLIALGFWVFILRHFFGAILGVSLLCMSCSTLLCDR
jgi:hypothetical protein